VITQTKARRWLPLLPDVYGPALAATEAGEVQSVSLHLAADPPVVWVVDGSGRRVEITCRYPDGTLCAHCGRHEHGEAVCGWCGAQR
jgi:hypothetical protein